MDSASRVLCYSFTPRHKTMFGCCIAMCSGWLWPERSENIQGDSFMFCFSCVVCFLFVFFVVVPSDFFVYGSGRGRGHWTSRERVGGGGGGGPGCYLRTTAVWCVFSGWGGGGGALRLQLYLIYCLMWNCWNTCSVVHFILIVQYYLGKPSLS